MLTIRTKSVAAVKNLDLPSLYSPTSVNNIDNAIAKPSWSSVDSQLPSRGFLSMAKPASRVPRLVGTNKSTSGSVKAVGIGRRLTAFVGRLHLDVNEKDLIDHLSMAGLSDLTCKKLVPKDGQSSSTAACCVSCAMFLQHLFYDESVWPDGCEVRDWYFKSSQTS